MRRSGEEATRRARLDERRRRAEEDEADRAPALDLARRRQRERGAADGARTEEPHAGRGAAEALEQLGREIRSREEEHGGGSPRRGLDDRVAQRRLRGAVADDERATLPPDQRMPPRAAAPSTSPRSVRMPAAGTMAVGTPFHALRI